MEPISKKWIWFVLPINVAAEGLHTAVPLFVLSLGGDIGDVSILTAIHYGAAALGSVFWGKVLDKYHTKKQLLVISFSVILICCVWLYFTKMIEPVYVISPLTGFFLVVRSSVTQMLVMESSPHNQWSRIFAKTSMLSTFGSLVAMLIGALWTLYFDSRQYFAILAVAAGIAIVISLKISRTHFHIELSTIAHSIQGISYIFGHFRLHNHFVFPRVPQLYDYKHIITILKGKITHEIGFLFLANFLFYLGSNIYFTSLTPFFKSLGISDSTIFLLYLIQMCTMAVFFYVAPKIISVLGEERATTLAYLPRICGVLIAGFAITLYVGIYSLIFAVISLCLMVVGFSIFSTANSVLFFRTIPKGFEGRYLGVNSSMVGLGVFWGALAAGFVTKSSGYTTTFLAASLVLVGSVILFRFYLRHKLSGSLMTN